MRKEKKVSVYVYILLALVAGGMLLYFGGSVYEKYFGSNVAATVSAPAYNCDTRARVPVRINGEVRQMRIQRKACADGRYTVGKVIQVKLHPFTRGILDDTAVPEIYLLSLIVLVVLAGIKRK